MRAIRATMGMLALVGLAGCELAEVGGPEPTSCELAAQHVASCMGMDQVEVQTGCDATAAAQAEGVLQQSCSDLVGDRSTMSLKDLLCKLLPFLCSAGNSGNTPGQPVGAGDIFRIGDCWHTQWGFCYDIVKLNPQSNCTEMMERPEWQLPQYTHYECMEPDGVRCRLVRVCQQFKDKGACINSVPHHNDEPKCQAGEPAPPHQPPAPSSGSGACNSDADCGGGLCYHDHTCVAPHSLPAGASCELVGSVFAAAVCQPGLTCKVAIAPGQAHGECGPPTQP